MSLADQIKFLPKVELHAHLSGSVSVETLSKLDTESDSDDSNNSQSRLSPTTYQTPKNTLECFEYFRTVGRVIVSLERLRICTMSVLQEFYDDGVVYLELRTTVKRFKTDSGNQTESDEYVECIRDCIHEFTSKITNPSHNLNKSKGPKIPPMTTRLLLSLDRSKIHSIDDAIDSIREIKRLCEKYSDIVVGIDICGDPDCAGQPMVDYILPGLVRFMEEDSEFFQRFPITIHTAESRQHSEVNQTIQTSSSSLSESNQIVSLIKKFNIRRLGHVTFLKDDDIEKVNEIVLDNHTQSDDGFDTKKVCVELCPTSNKVTADLRNDLKDHHFQKWWNRRRRGRSDSADNNNNCANIAICTDDTGLFSCKLSSELLLIAEAFELTIEDIKRLQIEAMKSSFLGINGKGVNRSDEFEMRRRLIEYLQSQLQQSVLSKD